MAVRRREELEAEERSGHERKDQDDESDESGDVAGAIERSRVIDGSDAEKTDAEKERGPKIPAVPKEIAEGQESDGKKVRGEAMKARKNGTKDVASIELPGGKKIQGSGK